MAENSAISWTRHTWNPVIGCSKVSPACDGCYAEAMMDKRYHKVQWGAPGQGTGTRVKTSASTWAMPFKWQRQAEKDGDRPFVFCASLADVFDNQWEPQWREEAFDVMRRTPNLVYLLLTKRPQNIIKLAAEAGGLPSNAAVGTTIEDQKRADINVPALIAAKRIVKPEFAFVSCEPLLGPIDLRDMILDIEWVITGGETDQGGHMSRPTHPEWFHDLRRQCVVSGAAFHHKQNGEWMPWRPLDGNPGNKPIQHVMADGSEYYPGNYGSSLQSMIKVGKKASGRELRGVTYDTFPEVSNV